MTGTSQQYLLKVKKVLLVVIVLFILIFSLISLILSFFILNTYQSFEENDMATRMNRFSESLNGSIINIERTAYDYAFWDDMALFSEGKNPDFPEQGMSRDSFIAINIDIIGIFNKSGYPLYLEDYSNPVDGQYLFRGELTEYINQSSPLVFSSVTDDNSYRSLIFHKGNLSGVLVSHPIFYHTTNEPGNGYVIMGRYFNDAYLQEISVLLKNPVTLLSDNDVNARIPVLYDSSEPKITVKILNESVIDGFLRIPDQISGEGSVFKISYPRDLYKEGISTLSTYLLLIAGIMGVFTILTLLGVRFYLRHADTSAKIALEKDLSYQKIIEEMEDAYFKANPEGIIEFVSQSSVKMLGYSDASELIGMPLSDLYQNPDDRNIMRNILFSEAELKNYPLVLKRKDGSLIFISTNVHLMYDEGGAVTGIEGIAHDNTSMILAKKTSQENESFYRLIFESANIGLFQSNPDGSFILVNPVFASMFGYASPDQMKHEVSSIVTGLGMCPEDLNRLSGELQEHGAVRNMEIALKRRDGIQIWLNCNIVVIKDLSDNTAAFFGTAVDISEKKSIELELIESQQEFRSLFYFSPVAIIVYDDKGVVIDSNSAAISLFGASKQSIPESEPLFYMAYLSEQQKADLSAGFLVNTEIKIDYDALRPTYQFPSSRTGIGYLDMIITPIPHPDSHIGWFLVQISDITERKVAEIARITATERLKEAEIIAKLGHWELDHQNNSLFWSDSVFHIFGKNPGAFIPTYEFFLSLIHPDDRDLVNEAYRQHIEENIPYDIIHRIEIPDEQVKYVREICKTETDSDGKPVRSVGIIHDITSIRLSELALRESEEKYRQMFSNVSHGLILFEFTHEGEPGKIIDLNPKAEEMIQKPLGKILEGEYQIQSFMTISCSSQVLNNTFIDTDICIFESGIKQGENGILPVQVTLDIFRLENNVVGLAIVEDITQKRLYEEERIKLIQQIEKNLAEFSILNDGIRNPLTIIMMMVDELDEEISVPVLKQIRDIDELIRQLDKRWIESDKILHYLQKYHNVLYK